MPGEKQIPISPEQFTRAVHGTALELASIMRAADDPANANSGVPGKTLMQGVSEVLDIMTCDDTIKEPKPKGKEEMNITGIQIKTKTKKTALGIHGVATKGTDLISDKGIEYLAQAIEMVPEDGRPDFLIIDGSNSIPGTIGNYKDGKVTLNLVAMFDKAIKYAREKYISCRLSIYGIMWIDLQWVLLHECFHSMVATGSSSRNGSPCTFSANEEEMMANAFADGQAYNIIRDKGPIEPGPLDEEPWMGPVIAEYKAKVINPAAARGEEWALGHKRMIERCIMITDPEFGDLYKVSDQRRIRPIKGYENFLEKKAITVDFNKTPLKAEAADTAPMGVMASTTSKEVAVDFDDENEVELGGMGEIDVELDESSEFCQEEETYTTTTASYTPPAPPTAPPTMAPMPIPMAKPAWGSPWQPAVPQTATAPAKAVQDYSGMTMEFEGVNAIGKAAFAIQNSPEAKAIYTLWMRCIKHLATRCGWDGHGQYTNRGAVMEPIFVGDIPNLPPVAFWTGQERKRTRLDTFQTEGRITGRGFVKLPDGRGGFTYDNVPGYQLLILTSRGEIDRRVIPQNPWKVGSKYSELAIQGHFIVHVLDGQEKEKTKAWKAKVFDTEFTVN